MLRNTIYYFFRAGGIIVGIFFILLGIGMFNDRIIGKPIEDLSLYSSIMTTTFFTTGIILISPFRTIKDRGLWLIVFILFQVCVLFQTYVWGEGFLRGLNYLHYPTQRIGNIIMLFVLIIFWGNVYIFYALKRRF